MKKIIYIALAAAALFMLLSLPAFAADRVLNVYNWGEYISDGQRGIAGCQRRV